MKTTSRLYSCLALLLLACPDASAYDTVLPVTARLWELRAGSAPQVTAPLAGHSKDVTSIAYSPDGALVATAGGDNTIILWQAVTGEKVSELGYPSGHTAPVTSIAFSPDSLYLISSGEDGLIKVWDIKATTKEPLTLSDYKGKAVVTAVAYSKSGNFASGGSNGVVMLWDTSGNKIASLPKFELEVYALAFSHDGKFLAVASGDKTIKLWDVAGQKLARTLKGHTGAVTALSFNPDGSMLASGSEDDTIKLWNPLADEVINTLTGHASSVTSVAFGKNGLLASGAWDGTIRLWNTRIGKTESILKEHTYHVTALAFSPDGQRFACGSIYPDEIANPRLFIISIGLKEYPPPLTLPYAQTGALAVADILERGGQGIFKAIIKRVILNSQVTRDAIAAAFEEISQQAHRQDAFVFYYAGRRAIVQRESEQEYYLAPTSIANIKDEVMLSSKGIPINQFKNWLDSIPAQKQLLLLDSADLNEIDGIRFLERVKGASKKPSGERPDLLAASAKLDRRDIFMMSVSIPDDDRSEIQGRDGHTPYTYYTLHGLAGEADRENPENGKKDGIVTTKELSDYLYSKLEELSNPKHKFVNNRWGQPFPILRIPERWRGKDVPISYKSGVTAGPLRRGKSYALLIATSKYDEDDEADGVDDDDGWDRLPNAVTDAEKIKDFLLNAYGFEKAEVLKDADYKTMVAKIHEFEDMPHGPEDQLLIYFAGHGVIDKYKEGYIVARDARKGDNTHINYLRYSDLRTWLDGSDDEAHRWWRHVLVILDVCHGGYFNPKKVIERGSDDDAFDPDIVTASPQQIVEQKMPHIVRRYIASGAKTVKEGFPGGVSPFTRGLLATLNKGRLKGGIMLGGEVISWLRLIRMETDPVANEFGKDNQFGDFIFFVK